MLKEGLSLTDEQSFQVKNILDEYRGLFDPEEEQRRAQLEESGDEMMRSPGTMPGDVPGTLSGRNEGDRRGRYGLRHGESMETRLMNAFKDVDEKIAKKINPLLTKEQQKMYVVIRKMQRDELKRRMNERLNRENR